MYKLMNYFFGWDYVYWENSADGGISRVRKLPDGTLFYWRYWGIVAMDEIKKPSQVKWLTCKSDKYFNN